MRAWLPSPAPFSHTGRHRAAAAVWMLFLPPPRRNAKILASAGPLNIPPAASSSTPMDVDPPAAPAGGAGALGGGSKPRRGADPALVSQVRCSCGQCCIPTCSFFRDNVIIVVMISFGGAPESYGGDGGVVLLCGLTALEGATCNS